MSEYQQVLACFLTVRRWFDLSCKSEKPLALRRLWVDTAAGAAKSKNAQSGGKQAEQVRVLEAPGPTPTRSQTVPYFPPSELWSDNESLAEPLRSMNLQDVGSTPRTLVLHLNKCYLQVCSPIFPISKIFK